MCKVDVLCFHEKHPSNLESAMKSILLPVHDNAQMPSAFETARLVANYFGGQVQGTALAPAFSQVLPVEPFVALAYPSRNWNEVEYTKKVRRTFDDYTRQHLKDPAEAARFRWRGGSVIGDAELANLARVYDLTVLNRPGVKGGRMVTLESALFESGRPVLMAGPSPPKSFGQTVVIHWNASTEVCRAMAMAMPILRKAKRVIVLSVEGNMVDGPSGREAVGYLEAHGIPATEKSIPNRGQRPGSVLLEAAEAQGADLLIKGAYTQSRLRQMIFGGATKHIIAAAELPVLLVH
jgi:nucleotide-binding universal stress UspA family protein